MKLNGYKLSVTLHHKLKQSVTRKSLQHTITKTSENIQIIQDLNIQRTNRQQFIKVLKTPNRL